jgi:hypothetical protein
MINPPYRRNEIQAELLGTTTWGVRKVSLEWDPDPIGSGSFLSGPISE